MKGAGFGQVAVCARIIVFFDENVLPYKIMCIISLVTKVYITI